MSFHLKQQLPKITDKTLLKRALATLKYQLTEHEKPVEIRGFDREILETQCALVVSRTDTGLGADIGFHQEPDGSFSIVSDDYAIQNLPEIIASLKRTYEEEKAIATARKMGYRVASRGRWIERGEKQFLQLRLTR